MNLPWGIEEDFNVTRFPSERLGEAPFCPTILEFSGFIFYQVLMDILLVGGTFTWSNNWDPPLGLELIDLLSLRIGKPNLLIFLKRCRLDFAWTVFPFFLTVEAFRVVEDILSSKICG